MLWSAQAVEVWRGRDRTATATQQQQQHYSRNKSARSLSNRDIGLTVHEVVPAVPPRCRPTSPFLVLGHILASVLSCALHRCTLSVHVVCARCLCTSSMHVVCARRLCTSSVHFIYARCLCTLVDSCREGSHRATRRRHARHLASPSCHRI